ncbi:unnamed protein product, partial [Oikopleura dioica]
THQGKCTTCQNSFEQKTESSWVIFCML